MTTLFVDFNMDTLTDDNGKRKYFGKSIRYTRSQFLLQKLVKYGFRGKIFFFYPIILKINNSWLKIIEFAPQPKN